MPKNATDKQKEQARKEALEQFEKNAPALVPYGEKELQAVQGRVENIMNSQNKIESNEDITFFQVTDPTQAIPVSQATGGSVILGYAPISLVNADTQVEAGNLFSESRDMSVKNATDVTTQVNQQAVSSAIGQSVGAPKQTQRRGSGTSGSTKKK